MAPHALRLAPALCLAALAAAAPLCLAQTPTPLTTTRIASGLTQPLCITHAPGDASRLFVLERTGRVRIYDVATGAVLGAPFLDLSSLVTTSWLEYGLLGIAFHPNYAQNGYFYVNYNPTGASAADTLVARYKVSVNPNIADAASATTILRFGFGTRVQHRAGWMDFGPDGFLYIATGDGAENDPDNAAQNTTLLRGKILRLDVNGPDGVPGTSDDDAFPADASKLYCIPATNPFAGSATSAPEIWAYGLRNPWRNAFDRLTGDLWIGDVGQTAREEINFQPAGSSGAVAGRNYGWRCTEGTSCPGLTGCTCNGPALTPPVYEYNHAVGLSVTGGYVYRGCAIPDLRGTYMFADYQNSKFFSFRYTGTPVGSAVDRTAELAPGGGLTLQTPASFGEDAAGELYICDYSGGEVFKIIPRSAPPASIAITQQPAPARSCAGGTPTLTVAAAVAGGPGVAPITYQWQVFAGTLGWQNIPSGGDVQVESDVPGALEYFAHSTGSTSAVLALSGIDHAWPPAPAQVLFRCLVSDPCATVTSAQAALTVCPIDRDCDTVITPADIAGFVNTWFDSLNNGTLAGDFDRNGAVQPADIAVFVNAWFAALTGGC